jgi:hypothetical protein
MLNALRQYGVDRDPAPLLAIAAQTLYPVHRENLMLAFKTCVPRKLWGSFDLEIEKHRSQALGLNRKNRVSNITNGTLTSIAPSTMRNKTTPLSPLADAAVNTSLSGGKAKPLDSPCIGKCALCTRSPMESPYTSRCCGRQACYTCWLKPLALHACPCGKGLKKSMLTKLYFK